jgi:putative spermidine/putrescine transport system permease protein
MTRATPGRPWLVLFGLACGGSVALALGLALAHSVGALSWPRTTTLDYSGWRALFAGPAFWHTLGYSLQLTSVTLVLALSTALALVAFLGTHLRTGLLSRALFLPLAVPGVVAALMAYILFSDSGWLSRLAYALGWLHTPAEFPSLIFDPSGRGIVLTHLAMITPLFVLLFERVAEHVRLPLLMQQATALGATRWQAWQHIAIPLLLTQTRAVIAVYTLALLGAYELPLLIGAAHPSMVSVAIARAIGGYDLTQRPLGYAMASLYLILLIGAWAGLVWRAEQRAVRS